MANIRIPGLVIKRNSDGSVRCYWQPSATLAKAGWTQLALGKDEAAAITAAQARNAEVALWKVGGIKPAEIRKRLAAGTGAALIARYRREVIDGRKPDGSPIIAASTASVYSPSIKRLERWMGDHPLTFVTPARVRALRNAMVAPADKGGIGWHPAHQTLKMGRQLFAFAIACDLVDRNPFDKFGLAAPPPRDVVWSVPVREAMLTTAAAQHRPSLALAIALGFAIGQREADILKLTRSHYVPIPEHKMQPEDWAVLSRLATDGVPMGVRVRQNKTKAWIEVAVVGQVRSDIETALARSTAGGATALILDDDYCTDARSPASGKAQQEAKARPYAPGKAGQSRFQRHFAECRADAAAAMRSEGREDIAAEIDRIQFRDLRRTCVVYLGELGFDAHLIASITGHDLDETQAILKTYMPRTTGRAAHVIAMTAIREEKAAATAAARTTKTTAR
jgi:integrase